MNKKMVKCADRALAMIKVMTMQEGGEVELDKTDMVLYLDFADKYVELDFDKLLGFDDINFAHDVFGIIRHMNHGTKRLDNCFLPRCST